MSVVRIPVPRDRPGGLERLPSMPWWTASDQAELDVLVACLVKGVEWHLARCPVAESRRLEGFPHWCVHLSGAVLEVVEWRDLRERHSRALWLRKLERVSP